MSEKPTPAVHWSFWLIAIVAMIWNSMSMLNFFMQMNVDMLASYRENARLLVESRPLWATIAFALAVFGGTLGSVLLLLRKRIAYYVLIASLLGVIVTMLPYFNLPSAKISFGLFELLMYTLLPLAVAIFLPWYARRVGGHGWLD